jgi:hypothetical protein
MDLVSAHLVACGINGVNIKQATGACNKMQFNLKCTNVNC